ncbi:MAG: SPOR domain-containing protein [Mariprofundaceae bacterium]|nr:SPOR domain-containing protein [Mariprofundaceae bacterium]
MSGKDFAHIEVPASEPEENDERPVRRTTIVVLIGLLAVVVMLAFSGGFWLGRDQGAEIASSQDKERLQNLIQKQKNELENLRLVAKQRHKTEQVSMTQVGDLIFYNDLPNQSVTPSTLNQSPQKKESTPSTLKNRDVIHQETLQTPIIEKHTLKPPVSSAVKKETISHSQRMYQIQLASFQKRSDAVLFLEKLKKKGLVTRIQEVDLATLGIWYRIYTGQYMDKKAAKKALLKLKESIHVTGLVVTQ